MPGQRNDTQILTMHFNNLQDNRTLMDERVGGLVINMRQSDVVIINNELQISLKKISDHTAILVFIGDKDKYHIDRKTKVKNHVDNQED